MSRILDVYLHGVFTGQLEQADDGLLSFTYNKGYLEQTLPSLSLSLPLSSETYSDQLTKAFFSGLLPDDIALSRIAKFLGISDKNPFALLKAIGGECAGAVSLYPIGEAVNTGIDEGVEILDEERLKEILLLLKSRPLLVANDGMRLSLAGAQEKLPVIIIENKIALTKGNRPTTHLLKPMISDIPESVENEFFCMRLARLVGIEVPTVNIAQVDKQSYFLVARYDRIQDDLGITKRLHQEDFCQALGIMPELKYEREGGPGIRQCQAILEKYSAIPAVDQLQFLKRIIFNYCIGNADAHGKNFSLLYKQQKPQLAPAYDLLSTKVYPGLAKKMAMRIGKKYHPEDVFMRHWCQLVPNTASAKKSFAELLQTTAIECLAQAQQLSKTLASEGIQAAIFDDICMVIKERVQHIQDYC